MATKKASSSSKKSASSRTAAAKAAAKKSTTKTVVAAEAVRPAVTPRSTVVSEKSLLPANLSNVVLAELFGTMILTLVALTTASLGIWYVGVTLVVLAMAFGAVSGAHVNPAVTFAMWVARKINWATGLVYWLAQLVGAILAFWVVNLMTGGQFAMNFTNFFSFNWVLFFVEFAATGVFLFGLMAVLSREALSASAKAVGVGMSLLVGLVVGGSLLDQVKQADYAAYQKEAAKSTDKQTKLPHSLMVKGAVANPAVALAITESTESQLTGSSASTSEKPVSRFGAELILGTLSGGAVGALLYMLTVYRPRD